MAETALKTDEEKKEFFDEPEVLDRKITQLSEMIKKSKHFIAFTGAGVSTASGIADFRSGVNTVLKTGPGAWEIKATKCPVKQDVIKVSSLKAIPSKAHMSFLALQQFGYLKFLISQNTDGLHRRSGFPQKLLAELHGNTNLEICTKCNQQYLRDYRTRSAQKVHDHFTGRKCDDPSCRGPLVDSIINFGQNLPEKAMTDGFKHAELADLCLAMGSSLRVTPAADMPAVTGKNADLVIVNLQKTPLDKMAKLKINGLCDQVIEKLMEKLQIPIPEFLLVRKLGIQITIQNKEEGILIRGLDSNDFQFTLFKSITINYQGTTDVLKEEPFFVKSLHKEFKKEDHLSIILQFLGNYGEPNLSVDLNFEDISNLKQSLKELIFTMKYSPIQKKWLETTKNSFQKIIV